MQSKIEKELLKVLKDEMKPSVGCTEPVAVALASSKAYQAVGGELTGISITTDPALFKTSRTCVVPGTNVTGYTLTAVLGILVGEPSLELEVLKRVDEKSVIKAKSWLKKGIVEVAMKEGEVGIYVEAVVRTSKGVGRAVIRSTHTNIVLVEANGKVIYKKKEGGKEEKHPSITSLKVTDLIRFVEGIPFEDIRFVLDAVKMNQELAQEGLNGRLGMGVGANMLSLLGENKIADDPITSAQILVASATDARFGGTTKPAMSIAGSGSHGITATLPVAVMAERMGIGEEKLARAIALSLLLTIYIKTYSGRLSAFCGCAVTAAVGASAGTVYLLGGDNEQIGYAIKNMAADVTGIICDGGNFSCALKTSTGAGAAVRAALLVLKGVVIPDDIGIVGRGVEETIKNMGRISSPGMVETDKVILDIVGRE
jgi:L-cysteine desulfidase